MTRRILVTGSRKLTNYWLVHDALKAHLLVTGRTVVVHGDAPGTDTLAAYAVSELRSTYFYWIDYGFDPIVEPHPADWDAHGKAAGPLRNQQMVDLGADVCLAFHRTGAGNRGTADCVKRAREAGIRVVEHWQES